MANKSHYIGYFESEYDAAVALAKGELKSPYVAGIETPSGVKYNGSLAQYTASTEQTGMGDSFTGATIEVNVSTNLPNGALGKLYVDGVQENEYQLNSGDTSISAVSSANISTSEREVKLVVDFPVDPENPTAGNVFSSAFTVSQEVCPYIMEATVTTTEAGQSKSILYSNNGMLGMEIDGEQADMVYQSYEFTDPGVHTIKYFYNSNSMANAQFRYTDIETFSASTGITQIGSNGLNSCYSLKSVYAPGVTYLNANAISFSSGVTDVTVSSAITYIGSKSIRAIPSLERINGTSDPVFTAVTFVGDNALTDNKLTSITFGSALTTMQYSAFANAENLQAVIFDPDSQITQMPNGAFKNCYSLTGITFPDSVTGHTSNSSYPEFEGCSGLTQVTFGKNTANIGAGMFKTGNSSLTAITCYAKNEPSLGGYGDDFASITGNTGTLYLLENAGGYENWISDLGSNWTVSRTLPVPTSAYTSDMSLTQTSCQGRLNIDMGPEVDSWEASSTTAFFPEYEYSSDISGTTTSSIYLMTDANHTGEPLTNTITVTFKSNGTVVDTVDITFVQPAE